MANTTFLAAALDVLRGLPALKDAVESINKIGTTLRQVTGHGRGAAFNDHRRKAGAVAVPLSFEPRIEAGKVIGVDVLLTPIEHADPREIVRLFVERLSGLLFPPTKNADGTVNHRMSDRRKFCRDAGVEKKATGIVLSDVWLPVLKLVPAPIYLASDEKPVKWLQIGFDCADEAGKPLKAVWYTPVNVKEPNTSHIERAYRVGMIYGISKRSAKTLEARFPKLLPLLSRPVTKSEPATEKQAV